MQWSTMFIAATAAAGVTFGFLVAVRGGYVRLEDCEAMLPWQLCAVLRQPQRTKVSIGSRDAFVYGSRGNGSSLVPAVFVLHGSYCKPEDMFQAGLEPLADSRGFLVVYPEMSEPGSANWGYSADLPYFAALVERFTKPDFGVDPARVFVSGHSAGGTMALFLQNEAADIFAGAAAVSAGVGHLEEWSLWRRGRPSMLVWNHADPVLAQFGGEGLYNQTLQTLRRSGSLSHAETERLPTGATTKGSVVSAELRKYPADDSPELWDLSWLSAPGTHSWPVRPKATFDAAHFIVEFFFQLSSRA